MNVPGTMETRRSTVRVCSECYTLMRPGKACCPECGENIRRREAWERWCTNWCADRRIPVSCPAVRGHGR